LPLSESLASRLHQLLRQHQLLRLRRLLRLRQLLLHLHQLPLRLLQLLQPQRLHLHLRQLQLLINCCRRLCAGWLLSTALT
jgi:hypothetical protein